MLPSSLASLWWLTLVGVIASTEGWLWIQSSGQQRKTGVEMGKMAPAYQQHPAQQYSYRSEGPWQYATYDSQPAPAPVVAVPLAVPYAAQMGMGGSVKSLHHPVQLVPCLCPITRDEPAQPQQLSYAAQSQPQQQQQQQQQQQPSSA